MELRIRTTTIEQGIINKNSVCFMYDVNDTRIPFPRSRIFMICESIEYTCISLGVPVITVLFHFGHFIIIVLIVWTWWQITECQVSRCDIRSTTILTT